MPISRQVIVYLALCLVLLTPAMAWAEPDVDRLMEWLGLSAAAKQADRVIEQNLQLDHRVVSPAQKQVLHQKLLAATGAETMLANTQAYIAQHLPIVSARAEAILTEPVAVRARNFDVAMEMAGSFEKFQSFVQQLEKNPPSEQRLALIQRMDKVLRTSAIATLLQTEIGITSRLLVAHMSDAPKPFQGSVALQQQRQQQRQQHMSEVVAKLNLFSYRYMNDDELSQYIALLGDSSIQGLLDVGEQGLLQGLEAGRAIALQ